MQNIIFGLISFLIAEFAFGYGAKKLFKKKKTMYLQLLVCAAGRFAIQQLSYIVNIWCRVTASFGYSSAPVCCGYLPLGR